MATHSSILVWRIPRREEPGRLQTIGSKRVWHNWETNTLIFHFSQAVLTKKQWSKIKNKKLLNENGYLIVEVLLKKSFLVSIEVFCLSSYEATTNHEVWLHCKNQKYAAIANHIFIYGIWPAFCTFKFAWICNALSHFISTYQPLSPKNQRSSTKVE